MAVPTTGRKNRGKRLRKGKTIWREREKAYWVGALLAVGGV
jgi:hypothetical protein